MRLVVGGQGGGARVVPVLPACGADVMRASAGRDIRLAFADIQRTFGEIRWDFGEIRWDFEGFW